MRITANPPSASSLIATAALAAFLGMTPWPAAAQQTAPPASAADSGGLFDEPRLLTKVIDFAGRFRKSDVDREKEGFYVTSGDMITGSGWISIGPGYRRRFFAGRGLADFSGGLSWRAYKTVAARLELSTSAEERITFGTFAMWQDYTQIRYFGVGRDTSLARTSDYRLQATDVSVYVRGRPRPAISIVARAGAMSRPGISASAGPFDRDYPDTPEQFPSDPGASLTRQPRYVHADVGITRDTRDHAGYPRRGGVYRASLAGFRGDAGSNLRFARVEAEAAHFLPVIADRFGLALRVWGVFSATAAGDAVPFYMLPSLGGGNTVRSYTDYRFHDRHMVVANVEARFPLFAHLDAALFVDAGSVAARPRDLDLSRTAYGAGLRLHTATTTIGRMDLAYGRENGWRLVFKLHDPLRLARLGRRGTTVPFVP